MNSARIRTALAHEVAMRARTHARTIVAVLGLASPALAQQAALTKVEVFPPDVNLATARDRQSLVVQATYADGITRDVTREASLTLANPALVRRDGNTFYPVADGATELSVAFAGRAVTIPVKVALAADDPALSPADPPDWRAP